MFNYVKKQLRKESFLPSYLSIVVSPVYIIRRGLLKSISQISESLKGNILDFGCGSKPYESLFINATSYIGVDIEASGHNHKDSKVDFYWDGKTLPFISNNFDGVVCFEVFEHIFNVVEVLAEINRVLKPKGSLIISIPFAWDEHEIPFDFARYTSFGITHVLNRNGFDVVSLKKTTTYFLAVAQMLIAYLYQYALPQGRFLGMIAQILIIFPLTVLSLIANSMLPKNYGYFCNCVVLARKRG